MSEKHTCPLCGNEHEGKIKAPTIKSARWDEPPPKARIVIADGTQGMRRGR